MWKRRYYLLYRGRNLLPNLFPKKKFNYLDVLSSFFLIYFRCFDKQLFYSKIGKTLICGRWKEGIERNERYKMIRSPVANIFSGTTNLKYFKLKFKSQIAKEISGEIHAATGMHVCTFFPWQKINICQFHSFAWIKINYPNCWR